MKKFSMEAEDTDGEDSLGIAVSAESNLEENQALKAFELAAVDGVANMKKKARKKRDPAALGSWARKQESGFARVLAAIAAAAFGAFLLQRFLRHKKKLPNSGAALLEQDLNLPVLPKSRLQHLQGLRVVCSALFDIEGASTKYSDDHHAPSSAEVLLQAMDAGAELRGRTHTEELNLGLLGDLEEVLNPAAPSCSTSGCSSGVAAVVANGLADVGLGSDHLSGVRVQSALFGLSGFRPTQGQISCRGVAAVTGSMETIGWLARDPALHPRLAETFKLPGAVGSFSTTELLQLVIASEVFELHASAGTRLKKIALSAAKKWAGVEQTASGLLVTYLQKNVPSAKSFVGYENDTDEVLEGIRRAAVTLQYFELLQRHGHLLEDPLALRPSVLEQLERAQDVGEDEVAAAEQVAAETSKAMRAILKDAVLILPALPSHQPAQGTDVEEMKQWERGTLQLAALATLAGCPQVTLPVPQDDGRPPLGLALLSLPKTDQRLAKVAAALAPLVEAAACSTSTSANQASTSRLSSQSKGRKLANGLMQRSEETLAEQEALKEAGNAAFKAGNYQNAVENYTVALKANPSNSVLYSNRAQALIKVGQYKEAEQDCSKALQFGPNAKALLRRGTARAALSDIDAAVQDFKHVLALEPSNRQARLELQTLMKLSSGAYDDVGMSSMFGGSALSTPRSDLSF